MPLVCIRAEGYGEQGHTRFLGCAAIFKPVAAFAGGDHVFPLVLATAGRGDNMVAGQLLTSKLIPAVQATMIVPSKQRSITQWRREFIKYTAIECDDGLQGKGRPNTGQSLYSAEDSGKGIADAVYNIVSCVGRDSFLQA